MIETIDIDIDEEPKPKSKGKNVKIKVPKGRLTEVEKLARQEAKEVAQAIKKSLAEQKRSEKPGNAINTITVLLPPTVIFKHEKLTPRLEAFSLNHEVINTSESVENLIAFRRDTVSKALNELNILVDRVHSHDEDQVIVLKYPDEYIPLIDSQLKGGEEGFIESVQILQTLIPDKKLTLILMESDKYFKKIKSKENSDYRKLVLQGTEDEAKQRKKTKKPASLPEISQTDFRSALVEMQLITNVNYRVVNKVEFLSDAILQYAKAIADAPFKKQKMSDGFDWYALSDCAGSIKVDKDGNGLLNLWMEQLMQFSNVGIETAKAILTRYPSPRALLTAYDNCTSMEEGLHLLQDIRVTYGIGPLAVVRKLGPELSKKIYRFFTVSDGDRCLGHSQST